MGAEWLEAAVSARAMLWVPLGKGGREGRGSLSPAALLPSENTSLGHTVAPSSRGCEVWQGHPTVVVSHGNSLGRVINGLQENNIY